MTHVHCQGMLWERSLTFNLMAGPSRDPRPRCATPFSSTPPPQQPFLCWTSPSRAATEMAGEHSKGHFSSQGQPPDGHQLAATRSQLEVFPPPLASSSYNSEATSANLHWPSEVIAFDKDRQSPMAELWPSKVSLCWVLTTVSSSSGQGLVFSLFAKHPVHAWKPNTATLRATLESLSSKKGGLN